MKSKLTQERLKELVHYDPETGHFTWRVTIRRARAGHRLGSTMPIGYRVVWIDGVCCYEHRLAWLYMTGAHPTQHIDHISGDKGDNRWANLREATRSQNLQNMARRKDNQTGVKGVSWSNREQAYRARLYVHGREKQIGLFRTIDAARTAIEAAREKYHQEFARHS